MSKNHNHAPGAINEKSYTPPKGFKERDVTSQAPTEKAIVARGSNAVAVSNATEDGLLGSDAVVPYLVVQQGLSNFVVARKTQMGDICKSTNPEKMGDPENSIELIFLHRPKAEYALEQRIKNSDKYKFRKSVPRNVINEFAEWNYWSDDNGLVDLAPNSPGATEWKRVKRLSVFALVVGDIAAEEAEIAKAAAGELPDPSKALKPVIISFRGKSYKAGRDVADFCHSVISMRAEIFNYKIEMSVAHEQNDKGQFYVWKPNCAKPTAVVKEHKESVARWIKIMNSGVTIRVDDSGEGDETEAVPF